MSARKASRAYERRVHTLAGEYYKYVASIPKGVNEIERRARIRRKLEQVTMKWLVYCEKIKDKYSHEPDLEAFNKHITSKNQRGAKIVKKEAKVISFWPERTIAKVVLLFRKLKFWK